MLAHSVTAEEPFIKVKVKVKFAQIFIMLFFLQMVLVTIGFFLFDGVQPLDFIGPWVCSGKSSPLSFQIVTWGSYLLFEGCLRFLETVLKISSSASYFWKNKGAYKKYKII